MTRPDNSTDDDDEQSERSSSLRDLAESTRQRRPDDRSSTSGTDIDLKTASEYEEENEFEFEDPGDLIDQEDWTLPPELESSSNILVLGPLRGTAEDRCCLNLLSGFATDPQNILFITLTRTVDDRLETWRRHMESTPSMMTVLALGEQTRKSDVKETITLKDSPGDISIESLADPSDLTRLGITLTEQLSALPDEGGGSALCIHSLTSLLQYVDTRRLFRFLHILQKKVDTVGAVAHYHLDPDTHDQQTVSVFETLFETVVRTTEDGDVEVVSTPN